MTNTNNTLNNIALQNLFTKGWRYPSNNPSIKDVANGAYCIQDTMYMPIEFINTNGKTSHYGSILVANNTAYPFAIIGCTDGSLWVYNAQTRLLDKK